MAEKQATHERREPLKEALSQLHDLITGKEVDVARKRVELDVTDVGLLRRKLKMSQREFAQKLGVSVDTIQNWEQGRREPKGPARALLNVVAHNPSLLAEDSESESDPLMASEQEVSLTESDVWAKLRAGLETARQLEERFMRMQHRRPEASASHEVDVYIGERLMQRRWMVGLTQQQLAERVGIKFQQLQKYERGTNRIAASRLWDIAAVLEVPVSFFFEGLGGEAEGEARGDILTDKEALELVRAYYAVPEEKRRRLFELARALGAAA